MTTTTKKETEQEFLPEKLSLNEICLNDLTKQANIKKLKKELNVKLIPKITSSNDEGYALVKEKLKLSQKARSGIEKTRKEHKAEALAYGKFVDGSASGLKDMVVSLETPWKELKESIDKAEEIKAENERLAELARTEEIEAKVNSIINTTANLVGANSSELKERLNLANMIIVDDSYDEYEEAAAEHKEKAIESLTAALAERIRFENQQEELEKGRRELAEAQTEIARLKGVSEKITEVVSDDAQTQSFGAPQSFHDEAEMQDAICHPKVQSEDVEPYINLTEPQMVTEYMKKLNAVETPDVGDDLMKNIVTVMTDNLKKLSLFVATRTEV